MPFFYDQGRDDGLNQAIVDGTRLHHCSAEPVDYAAVAGVELAAANVTLTLANGDISGRKISCPAVNGVTPSASGNVNAWAITDDAGILVSSGTWTQFAVTIGVPFNSPAFDVHEMRDAVSE